VARLALRRDVDARQRASWQAGDLVAHADALSGALLVFGDIEGLLVAELLVRAGRPVDGPPELALLGALHEDALGQALLAADIDVADHPRHVGLHQDRRLAGASVPRLVLRHGRGLRGLELRRRLDRRPALPVGVARSAGNLRLGKVAESPLRLRLGGNVGEVALASAGLGSRPRALGLGGAASGLRLREGSELVGELALIATAAGGEATQQRRVNQPERLLQGAVLGGLIECLVGEVARRVELGLGVVARVEELLPDVGVLASDQALNGPLDGPGLPLKLKRGDVGGDLPLDGFDAVVHPAKGGDALGGIPAAVAGDL
jgi:hypothetical protein